MEEPRTLLEHLQKAPEEKKRRWMVWGSIVACALFLVIWFSYFNGIVSSGNQSVAAAPTGEFSATQAFQTGAGVMYNAFVDKIKSFTH